MAGLGVLAGALVVHRRQAVVVGRLTAALLAVSLLLPTGLASLSEVGRNHEAPVTLAAHPQVAALLTADLSGARFTAAVCGGRDAAYLELQSGRPVLDIGVFNGHGPLPALQQLQWMALHGQSRYFVRHTPTLFGLFTPGASRWAPALDIAGWVSQHFSLALALSDVQVWDLGAPCSVAVTGLSRCGGAAKSALPRFT